MKDKELKNKLLKIVKDIEEGKAELYTSEEVREKLFGKPKSEERMKQPQCLYIIKTQEKYG